jgi:hypothetical protein
VTARIPSLLLFACSLDLACGGGTATPISRQETDAGAGGISGASLGGSSSGATQAHGGRDGGGGSMLAGADGTSAGAGAASAGNAGTGSGEPPTAESGGAAGEGEGSQSSDAGAAGASFEERCRDSASDDCEVCLCTQCSAELQSCSETSGCLEIIACIRASGCTGVGCYCGTFDAAACASGQADGPCRSAMLNAPGGKVPTLLSPSAGPAADAAVAIDLCMQAAEPCAVACES